MDLQSLLAPKSIAVVGASMDPVRIGGRPIAYLKRAFSGAIYPVNPKRDEVQGLRCYAQLSDVPEPVDLVLLCVGADSVVDELRKAADCGAKTAVIFAAGFSETNDVASMEREAEVSRIARESGMAVLGPNTTGVANLFNGALATFATPFREMQAPSERGIAILGQSGATCNSIVMNALRDGVPVKYYVATGNETCLGVPDVMDHLAGDPTVDAVVAYMEGIRDGALFLDASRRLSARGVPLIVLKVGSSEKGREASASHTAAIAGDASVSRAAFIAGNVIAADDLGHLADLSYLSLFSQRRLGSRVGVLTASGAAGVMVADVLDKRTLTVPTFSEALQAALRERIPNFGMVANPVDLTANVLTDELLVGHAIRMLTASDEVDMIVFVLAGHMLLRIRGDLEAAAVATKKMILVIDPDGTVPRDAFRSSGVPVFHRIRDGLVALESLTRWQVRRRASQRTAAVSLGLPSDSVNQAIRSLEAAQLTGRSHLTEAEGFALLGSLGMPVPRSAIMTQASEAAQALARTGAPAVLKVLSANIQHKSEVDGIRLNLHSVEEVGAAFEAVSASVRKHVPLAHIEGAMLQQQMGPALELLVGVRRDTTFGLVMTVAMGGVQAELLADAITLMLPVDESRALDSLTQLRLYPLLEGYRGAPRSDVQAACAAIARLSAIAQALDHCIEELEINPLALYPANHGVMALDCLISLSR